MDPTGFRRPRNPGVGSILMCSGGAAVPFHLVARGSGQSLCRRPGVVRLARPCRSSPGLARGVSPAPPVPPWPVRRAERTTTSPAPKFSSGSLFKRSTHSPPAPGAHRPSGRRRPVAAPEGLRAQGKAMLDSPPPPEGGARPRRPGLPAIWVIVAHLLNSRSGSRHDSRQEVAAHTASVAGS